MSTMYLVRKEYWFDFLGAEMTRKKRYLEVSQCTTLDTHNMTFILRTSVFKKKM